MLRTSVSVLLYSQTRRLARLASKCDGKPVELEDPGDDEDDEGEHCSYEEAALRLGVEALARVREQLDHAESACERSALRTLTGYHRDRKSPQSTARKPQRF